MFYKKKIMILFSMKTFSMKTFSEKGKNIKKDWWIVDVSKCETKILGRLASKIAFVLKGKHKTTFTPNLDCGDNVILINADQIELTGDKKNQKIYYRHSGYMSGLKQRTFSEQYAKNPRFVVEEAVKGMLTRTTLRRYIMKHFYVYTGSEHPHIGQNPKAMEI